MTQREFFNLAKKLEQAIDIAVFDEELAEIRSKRDGPSGPAAMVCRFEPLKLKMYQERGHKLPHIHVDYGRHSHVASYSIEPAEVLEGNLPSKHHATVMHWIRRNKDSLLRLWQSMQSGVAGDEIVADLREKA